MTIAPNGFKDIFTQTHAADCVVLTCSIKESDCMTPLPAQFDISVGSSPIFPILATELNPKGFSHTICYSCGVKPFGLSLIYIIKNFGDIRKRC